MPSRGAEARAFNTMVKPSDRPKESIEDGLSAEEKATVWAAGNLYLIKRGGGEARKSTPRIGRGTGKDARGVVLGQIGKIDTSDVGEEGDPPLESAEERMRERSKGKAIRISGAKEEEEIKEAGKTEMGSGSASTMPNSPMTGVVWGEARTGLATEGSSGEKRNLQRKGRKR